MDLHRYAGIVLRLSSTLETFLSGILCVYSADLMRSKRLRYLRGLLGIV